MMKVFIKSKWCWVKTILIKVKPMSIKSGFRAILFWLKVRSVGGEPEDTKEIGHRSTTTVEVVFYLFFCLFFVFVFLGGGLTQQDILFHPVISQLSVIVRKHYLNFWSETQQQAKRLKRSLLTDMATTYMTGRWYSGSIEPSHDYHRHHPLRIDKPARLTIRVLLFLFLITICQIRS